MKNTVKLLIMLSIAMILIGCGGISSADFASPNFDFKNNKDIGLIVFSQSHSQDLDTDNFYFKNMDEPNGDRFESENAYFGATYDFEGDYNGNLKIYTLKAGKYQFYRWNTMGYKSTGNGAHKLRFHVKAGEVVYLGSLAITKTKRKLINPHKLSLTDERKRDFKIFEKKMKKIPVKKITVRFPEYIQE